MVASQLDFRVFGVAAIASKSQAVFVLCVFRSAQQFHTEHVDVKINGALKVANAQHGV
jgi:hypothetical protein